ncbi:glycosyltransferase, partial [Streptomyces sp. SID4917]|nr:glycosyltransferase [Streptomyces sp. SID4917]
PVLWLLWHSAPGRAGLPRLAAGLLLPVLAAALLTDPSGFLFWTLTGSAAYAAFTGSGLHMVSRGLANTALLALACSALLAPLARARRTARSGTADLWVWLAASAVAVVAGFHFFGHYFLQLV